MNKIECLAVLNHNDIDILDFMSICKVFVINYPKSLKTAKKFLEELK